VSIQQAAAQAQAVVDRARSLFGSSPAPVPPAGESLESAVESTAGLGRRTAGLSGDLVDAHNEFVAAQTRDLSSAGRTDTTLASHLSTAATVTATGARQLDAIGAQTHAIAQTAATARTPAAQRAVLAALRSQVAQANDVVTTTQQQAGDIADQIQALRYRTEPADFKQRPPTDPSPPFHGITEDQFKKIYTNWDKTGPHHVLLPPDQAEAKARAWTQAVNAAMEEQQINTPLRQAAFLAESAEETDWGASLTEYADGSEYQGRLGNVNPGDGELFKGRGGLQLTGRANYEAAARGLGLPDLVTKPELASEDVTIAFRTAGWYWRHGNGDLNVFADQGDIVEISHKINGGDNGLSARIENYNKILNMLNSGG